MTVPYTSAQAQVVERAILMLAATATFQRLTGAASATAAKGRIIESWGGDPSLAGRGGKAIACDGTAFTATPVYAHVHVGGFPSRSIGVGVYEHNGTATVGLVMARRIGSETPPESFRRARNDADAIRYEMESLFGQSTYLARGSIDVDGPELGAESGADGDSLFASLIISYEG